MSTNSNYHNISAMIEQTLLSAVAGEKDIEKLCKQAIKHNFFGICVAPSYVKTAKSMLLSNKVAVITTVGFPFGTNSSLVKACETEDALSCGADEIDMVIHIGSLINQKYQYVCSDIEKVVKAAGGKVVKVIIETGYLSEKDIKSACSIIMQAGADYVKTCTGYGPGKAEIEDVKVIKQLVGDKLGIKAAGGIRDWETAAALIEAGANRIGTSSGVDIINSYQGCGNNEN